MFRFKNPITLWLKRTIANKHIQKLNKHNSLRIGYMSIVHNCTFGKYNTIGDNVSMSNVVIGDMSYVVAGTSIKNTII